MKKIGKQSSNQVLRGKKKKERKVLNKNRRGTKPYSSTRLNIIFPFDRTGTKDTGDRIGIRRKAWNIVSYDLFPDLPQSATGRQGVSNRICR